MPRGFACPECGARIAPAKVGPGRQLRCGNCDTLVEVPFFPRARRRGRPKKWQFWARVGAACALALFALAGLGQLVRTFQRASAVSEKVERPRLITRDEAKTGLDAAERLEATAPTDSVKRYESLLERVRANPELADLRDRIQSERDRARERSIAADLALAHQMVDSSDVASAVRLCERVVWSVAALPPGRGITAREEAISLADHVASTRGVLLEPVRGKFVLGSTASYDDELHPVMAAALEKQGYATLAHGSPFESLWEKHAPYRMLLQLTESQNEEYLQSRNRTSAIEGRAAFNHGSSEVWFFQVAAETRVPLPNIGAFEDTRLAFAPKRNPEVEQRFYQDARNSFRNKAVQRLRDLPPFGSPRTSTATNP
jgi:hypothetical protein